MRLQHAAVDGVLDLEEVRAALRSGPTDWKTAYGFNVIQGHNEWEISPLFWLTPEISAEAFHEVWAALAALTERAWLDDEVREVGRAVRSIPRSMHDHTVWALGAPADKATTRLLVPTLQRLALAAAKVSDSPPTLNDESTSVVVDGRTYEVTRLQVNAPRLYGGSPLMPHGRRAQYWSPRQFTLQGCAVETKALPLWKYARKDPLMSALLRSCVDTPEGADAMILKACEARKVPRPPMRHRRRARASSFRDEPMKFDDYLAAEQPFPDLDESLTPGKPINLAGLYHLLVLELGATDEAEFKRVFGEFVTPDGRPRIILVPSSKRHWKSKAQHLVDAARIGR